MQIAKIIVAAAYLALSSFGLPLSAQSLPETDLTAIDTAVDDFNTAFTDSDFSKTTTYIPPNVMSHIAQNGNISVEQLKVMMVELTQEALATVTLKSFVMETSAATYGTTDADRPYALIPTRTLMAVPNVGDVEGISTTLALKDDGTWYLMRIEQEQQIDILRTVYPDFNSIDFPPGSMNVIE